MLTFNLQSSKIEFDLAKDPNAVVAVSAYAEAIQYTDPSLSRLLWLLIQRHKK